MIDTYILHGVAFLYYIICDVSFIGFIFYQNGMLQYLLRNT